MTLILDNPAVPSGLVEPKNLKLDLLVGQDFESDGLTLRTATYDGVNILIDGSPLVAAADVKSLDLTFDAADNALVIYTDNTDNVFMYDDDGALISDLSVTGVNPRIHNDRQAAPSIVVSYQRGNDVFYRIDDGQPPDPFFANVALLMHLDGDFTDSSVNNFLPSNTALGLLFDPSNPKFGSASLLSPAGISPGNGVVYGSAPAEFIIGTGDYTVECWVYETGSTNFAQLFFSGGSTGSNGFAIDVTFPLSPVGRVRVERPGSDFFSTQPMPLDQWVHLAVTRSSGTLRIFINGIISGSFSDPINYSSASNNRFFSANGFASSQDTFYDDFRFTVGVARYTSNFAPPTLPFPDN